MLWNLGDHLFLLLQALIPETPLCIIDSEETNMYTEINQPDSRILKDIIPILQCNIAYRGFVKYNVWNRIMDQEV